MVAIFFKYGIKAAIHNVPFARVKNKSPDATGAASGR
jgi:hypothetical protein